MSDLNKTQIEMLKEMLNWGSDYYYPYSYFDDIFDIKTLKREMRGLIAKGYVRFFRGGINDDGEVSGGSGFALDHGRRKEIKELVEATPMTDEEVLIKAIEKALKNGWLKGRDNLTDYSLADSDTRYWFFWKDNSHHVFLSVEQIIFSHSFAKAFWGEDLKRQQDGELNGDPDWCIPEWQYHLQQMVLSQNPIQYLAQFLVEATP